MSPCSYINDAATEDLQSILFIKRKTNSGGRHTVRQPKDLQGGSNREGVFAHSSAAIAAAGLKRKLDAIGSGDGGKGRCSPVEEHKGGPLEQQQELSSKRPYSFSQSGAPVHSLSDCLPSLPFYPELSRADN